MEKKQNKTNHYKLAKLPFQKLMEFCKVRDFRLLFYFFLHFHTPLQGKKILNRCSIVETGQQKKEKKP